MADINKQTSPYSKTEIKDFYLGVWVPRDIQKRNDDIEYTITLKYHLRPDLLSNDLYGSPRLYWIFARRNMDILIDPIEDFKAGTKIMAPKTIEGIA